jgi:hypothetical protein
VDLSLGVLKAYLNLSLLNLKLPYNPGSYRLMGCWEPLIDIRIEV